MDEGVIIISPKGQINFINPYAKRIFDTIDSTGIFFTKILAQDSNRNDEIIDLVMDTIQTGEKTTNRMVHYTTKNGTVYSLLTCCTKMEDGNFVFTFSDQTAFAVETQKRHDSVFVLTVFFLTGSLWTVGVSFWMHTGEVFPVGDLTKIVEVMGFIALLFLLRYTHITIRDFGLSPEKIKPTMKRTAIRLAVLLAVFCIVKCVILLVRPDYFPDGAPFWDWRQADMRLIQYLITAFVQEFLARGGVQSALDRVFSDGNNKNIGIYLTSLYFMSLHFPYSLPMMIGAGVLSILLGFMYKKDGNIFGVTLFHYCFGKFADFLLLLQ